MKFIKRVFWGNLILIKIRKFLKLMVYFVKSQRIYIYFNIKLFLLIANTSRIIFNSNFLHVFEL